MDLFLQGKTALVTGSGRGIGRAVALRLASHGATVIVNARTQTQAQAVVDEILTAGGQASLALADLADPAAITDMFAEIRSRHPRLDILVNNAGAATGGMTPFQQATPEQFDAIFGLNVRGLFFVTQQASAMMADGGRIVNVSSISTRTRRPGLAIYGASKGAVDVLTRTWAADLAPRGITVNGVAPGVIETEGLKTNMSPDALKAFAAPFGRMGQPQDVADLVAFLAGPNGGWITGQTIETTGGA